MSNLIKSMVYLWGEWFNLYKEYYKYHSFSITWNYMCILMGLGRLSLGYSPRHGITELQNKHTFNYRKCKIAFQDAYNYLHSWEECVRLLFLTSFRTLGIIL